MFSNHVQPITKMKLKFLTALWNLKTVINNKLPSALLVNNISKSSAN